jgi:transcriptional regulator with XRE-family HTH domain
MIEPDAARRSELGEFLKAQRARVTPAMVGLPQGRRRRTPGLRREEVAQLCGLSTTWYSWVEQGRDISLSAAALSRIASVLRLTSAQRAYLFELAGRRDPQEAAEGDPALPDALPAVVDAFPGPAYLLDHRWDALRWNAAAADLFRGWLEPAPVHDLLSYIFLNPIAPRLIVDWEARARRVVAEFRVDYSRHLDDEAVQQRVDALREQSEPFARLWDEHGVIGREGGERLFDHPRGRLRFQQVTLHPAQRPDLKLVLLVPQGGPALADPSHPL